MLSQLEYWSLLLPACSGRVQILDLKAGPPAWGVEFFTDSAGGDLGLGSVGPGFWFFVPWPRRINAGEIVERGKQLQGG